MGKKSVSGTREWAASSANCMTGCANGCLYCYAKANAVRFGKATPANWTEEKLDSIPAARKHKGTVMFPTKHDITLTNWQHCCHSLQNLLSAGNNVLVVSKPKPQVVRALCNTLSNESDWAHMNWRDQVLFRFTIGSMDPERLAFWEPNAPTFAERLYSLMWAIENGWKTSVSMEPMLDLEAADVIRTAKTVAPYVSDSIWIGKANKLRSRCETNAGEMATGVLAFNIAKLEQAWTDENVQLLRMLVTASPALVPKVKWKESIKKVLGIEIPDEPGLDI